MAHTIELRRAWHDITAFQQHTRWNDVGHGMPSSPLGSTNDRTTSGVACHHCLWAAQMVEQRRVWHDITALGLQSQSNDNRRGMTSPPLDYSHGRTKSGMACPHYLWTAHTVKRRRALHAIIAFGQHTRSNNVWRGMTSPPLDNTHSWQHRAWHDITDLDNTHGRQRRVWHDITTLRQQTRYDDVGRGMK